MWRGNLFSASCRSRPVAFEVLPRSSPRGVGSSMNLHPRSPICCPKCLSLTHPGKKAADTQGDLNVTRLGSFRSLIIRYTRSHSVWRDREREREEKAKKRIERRATLVRLITSVRGIKVCSLPPEAPKKIYRRGCHSPLLFACSFARGFFFFSFRAWRGVWILDTEIFS